MKAIALLARERSATLPGLATADQQGLSGFDTNVWNALFLPAGTPEPIVRRLHDAIAGTLELSEMRNQLVTLGITVVPPERRSTAYLKSFLATEIAKWAAAIKASGVGAD